MADFPVNIAEAQLEQLRKLPGIGEKKGKAIIALRAEGDITMEKLVLATNMPQSEWASLYESGKVTIPGVPEWELRLESPDKSPVKNVAQEQVAILQTELALRDSMSRENEEMNRQKFNDFEEMRVREARDREDSWRREMQVIQERMELQARENEERWVSERREMQERQERMFHDIENARRERDEFKQQCAMGRSSLRDGFGGGHDLSALGGRFAPTCRSPPLPHRKHQEDEGQINPEHKQTVQFQLKSEAPDEKGVLGGGKGDSASHSDEFISKVEKRIPQDGIYSRRRLNSVLQASPETKTLGSKISGKTEQIDPTRWEVAAEQSQIREYLEVHAGDLQPEVEIGKELNQRIHLYQGDITSVKSDVIVTAANSQLRGGSGVDGAIHRAAGPELADACKKIGNCPVGGAVITGAYKLHAEAVIHTVGPKGESKQDLANCYWSVLDLVANNRYRKVVIPVISGGAYNYPVRKSVPIALKAIRNWLLRDSNYLKIEQIVLCVFSSQDCKEYVKALARIFPTNGTVALYRRHKPTPAPIRYRARDNRRPDHSNP